MRTNYLLSFVMACLFLGGCGRAEKNYMASEKIVPGAQQERAFAKTITKKLSLGYLLYLPKSYGEKEQGWPLMMFLHGAGERGSDLNKVKVHGPPKIVGAGKDMPFIIVSPQCPEGDWWTEKNDQLINLLDDIQERYNVDTERVYLTGLSMGGVRHVGTGVEVSGAFCGYRSDLRGRQAVLRMAAEGCAGMGVSRGQGQRCAGEGIGRDGRCGEGRRGRCEPDGLS